MNYYETLGVSKSASQDEIKRAFRKLASQTHPDKGGDTQKFQEIQQAYDTLSDPQKRAIYDNPQPQFQQFRGVPPEFDDLFGHMFGKHPFGEMFNHSQSLRNRNLSIRTQISLEDAYTGKELTISIMLPSGREQICEIKIPKGIQDGTTIRLAGIGDNSYPNMPRGDIHLTVSIQPHPVFQRHGDDLIRSLDINAFDAILGCSQEVNTIDKKTLEVKIKPGTQPGTMLAAHGYGMPNVKDNRLVGRMLIQINVIIPTNLTNEQLNKLKEINI